MEPASRSHAFANFQATGFQQNAIFVINADGSNLRQLTAWGLGEEHPGWSPDSQWIVFDVAKESSHPAGGILGIYLIRPDGSTQTDGQRVYEDPESYWNFNRIASRQVGIRRPKNPG